MIINTRKIFLSICCMCLSLTLFPQKKEMYLHELQMQHVNYVDTDTARIWITQDIPDLLIFSLQKENGEYFVTRDTIHRDYILLGGGKYLVDSLWLIEYNNYAMRFEYVGAYIAYFKHCSCLIVTGCNAFQMGTDVQPLYAVFKEKDNKFIFQSSYVLESVDYYSNEILNSVKIIFEKDNITMQGINLNQIR